jgi:hypothetical protein
MFSTRSKQAMIDSGEGGTYFVPSILDGNSYINRLSVAPRFVPNAFALTENSAYNVDGSDLAFVTYAKFIRWSSVPTVRACP